MSHKYTRNLLKALLAVFALVGVFSFSPKEATQHTFSVAPSVHADLLSGAGAGGAGAGIAPENNKQEFADNLEVILKVIYLLLWPFLALAGLALDNGLVYGSYFQLDAALFTFWNIIKNFTNFVLGFLFLWSILKYIFDFGGKAEKPTAMITKLLIAGIGIQASRFIMGALIDVSTVATIGIGAMPLRLLKEESLAKKPLFGMKTNLKISDIGTALTSEKGFVILYSYPTNPNEYYLPCAVKDQKVLEGNDRATAFGIPLNDPNANVGNTDVTRAQINQQYCLFGNNILSFDKVDANNKIEPGSDEFKKALNESQEAFRNGNNCDNDTLGVCQTIANIAEKGKGYQGAFYSLYGSILNLGAIHIRVDKSNGSMTLEALVKAVIGIAYLVPLLILCVVLIIRVAVLWITIAFSPLLVLSKVFDFNLGKSSKSLENFTVSNVISTIFLPVIVTFAISISIVFLSVLSEGLTKGTSLAELGMNTFTENNKSCINLIVTTLCIDMPTQDTGVSGMLDFFPWIILNIFGIGLMRTILMAAFKSNVFTKGVAEKVQGFAEQAVKTAPIIPIGGGVGIGSLSKAGDEIKQTMQNAQYKDATIITRSLDNVGQSAGMGGYKSLGDKQMTEYISAKDATSKEKAIRTMTDQTTGTFRSENNSKNELRLDQYGKGDAFAKSLWEDVMGTDQKFNGITFAFKDPEFLKKLKKKYPDLTAENVKRMYSAEENANNTETEKIRATIDDTFDETTSIPPAPVTTSSTTQPSTTTTTPNSQTTTNPNTTIPGTTGTTTPASPTATTTATNPLAPGSGTGVGLAPNPGTPTANTPPANTPTTSTP